MHQFLTVKGVHMEDVYEVLRLKEIEKSRLETEVEALRLVLPLLSEERDAGNGNKPTPARSHGQVQPVPVPPLANTIPQPEESARSREQAQGWP